MGIDQEENVEASRSVTVMAKKKKVRHKLQHEGGHKSRQAKKDYRGTRVGERTEGTGKV